MRHIVYILQSQKLDRFYIGYSSDVEKRLEFHQSSETRKFTHKADDWELIFEINCHRKSQALQIEQHIKQMKSKVYIKNLMAYPEMVKKLKEKYNDC